ncbi:hypothetical protein [Pseudobacteriovorax antillogorgiicola]|uniref:Uncharacterized protein n=1 Tax=Pseudobacteriovorax antillogorgiicola TaxID=1513793 RepID=A0A1Y6B5J6_9BACT|nr:hypothetical protein [Pseudobacteriovorax antillogorgiicola]TCS59113.1 hypothetical protein EDD56_10116 [Pseudobacteriovorax antillogorgiicola]SME91676.1 hypothetical protein SAMN06296036_101470 [Pseudobacteriovorax antillogorgiicola]
MIVKLAAMIVLGLGMQSCSTNYLNKYNRKPAKTSRTNSAATKGKPAKIVAIDKNTFRFHLSFNDVWNTALDVLLENYNLTIVDRRSGVITTEWDSFFLDGKVYRNKVSLRVKKLNYSMVDVTIHNSVESLQNVGHGGIASAWLPYPKNAEEMGRIVHNMAINLGQPKPVLPREMIATYGDQKATSSQ